MPVENTENTIESQWYFDLGAGMSEEGSIRERYSITSLGSTRQSISVPSGCKSLRWDPCESPCLAANVEFRNDDDEKLTPIVPNGFVHGNNTIFNHSDPQFLIDLGEGALREFTLTVSAEIYIANDRLLIDECAEIAEENKRLREELRQSANKGLFKKRTNATQESLLQDSDKAANAERKILRDLMTRPQEHGLFVPYKEHQIHFGGGDVKPIAFYLPQYHTIPENDLWWGKGFTEWTNVTQATPWYAGHYQPHLPFDVGFYDLSNFSVMERQIELAKNYGVYGFCFYYYWFDGKRLLEKPVNQYLDHAAEADFPFCLCWANENWTKRWDGSSEVLMEQKYSDEDSMNLIADLAGYIEDERYIKIDGKPLVIIYRGNLIPDLKRTISLWKEYCLKSGIGDIVVAGIKSEDADDPAALGFDIGIDFPPHGMSKYLSAQMKEHVLSPPPMEYAVYDLSGFIENINQYVPDDPANLKTVFPNWDNSPRWRNGPIMYPLSPAQYKVWLSRCIEATKAAQTPDGRFMFINAWNEWAEGAHLEPDQRYGYAYLEATAEAIEESK